MTKLSETQRMLLSHAEQRPSGNLLPFPAAITAPRPATDKWVRSLLARGLIVELEIADPGLAWRQDGDVWYGVHVSDAGRVAIALAPSPAPNLPPAITEKKQTKASLVVGLLRRTDGATLDELVTATGWLPHTTRAALTGLRKKGHELEKSKRADVTCYSIVETAC